MCSEVNEWRNEGMNKETFYSLLFFAEFEKIILTTIVKSSATQQWPFTWANLLSSNFSTLFPTPYFESRNHPKLLRNRPKTKSMGRTRKIVTYWYKKRQYYKRNSEVIQKTKLILNSLMVHYFNLKKTISHNEPTRNLGLFPSF